MRPLLKESVLIVIPENEDESSTFQGFGARHSGRLFRFTNTGTGLQFFDMGLEEIVCNKPINITSHTPAPLGLISNFARTPFHLDGLEYVSVEGFWQSLKFDGTEERIRAAGLSGSEAKRAATGVEQRDVFDYGGEQIRTGTWGHWQLMRRACMAKFEQNEDARSVLLSTGDRPLAHKVKHDSRTIPGIVMADIWMRVRRRLRDEH